MTFDKILKELEKGSKVKRETWASDRYIYKSEFDDIRNEEQNKIILNFTDYQANDWEIYKEREYMSFGKAFEKMKEGYKIRHKSWGVAYIYIRHNLRGDSIKGHCYFPVVDDGSETKMFSLKEWIVLDDGWFVIE